MLKPVMVILGTISLCLGILGIFIPGLPTTPFILLTAGLYVRSSDMLYKRLINSKVFGSYISEFQERKGLTLKAKLYSITLMWTMILVSVFFVIDTHSLKYIIVAIGLIGTIVMGYLLPTISDNNQ